MAEMYLYNGVKLPKLPEWDETVYPYAFIMRIGSIYKLGIRKIPPHVSTSDDGSIRVNITDIQTQIKYELSGDAWVSTEYITGVGDIIWSNTDVENNTDGSVYLAASEPIPVSDWTPDPTSMLMGWLTGRQIAGQRKKQERDPVAYLYNGVRLPKLPEWAKSGYPYIAMYWSTDVSNYFILGFPVKPVNTGLGITMEEDSTYKRSMFVDDDFVWMSSNEVNEGNWWQELQSLVWANFDVLAADGNSVYLSASDPIPVYE